MRSMSLPLLWMLASSVTRAEPPVPASPGPATSITAADAKAVDEFLLTTKTATAGAELVQAKEPIVVRRDDPAATIAANLRLATAKPAAPRPYSTECRGDTCYRYDGRGNLLFRTDRDNPRNVRWGDSDTGIRKAECLGQDDMLDTFERLSRCNGIGLRLPTPWDPVESIVPLADRP